MKQYEKIRADISRQFKSEIEGLKLEIIRLNQKIDQLQKDKKDLEKQVKKYKGQLDNLSDSQKSLLGLSNVLHLL